MRMIIEEQRFCDELEIKKVKHIPRVGENVESDKLNGSQTLTVKKVKYDFNDNTVYIYVK